ncbi:MAG: PASTA domain-containing protein [Thermoleophilia bacterium]|nr:PASTA domain-containing protein [Thermoleophilia bacterium]
MARPLHATLLRVAALAVVGGLATSTLTLAASPSESSVEESAGEAPARGRTLSVPDVRRQAFVFAKGILDDAGFAWRVEGSIRGYAANVVAQQDPAPNTRVLDNGSPTVVLRLVRAPGEDEQGIPEDVSPYAGTATVADGGGAGQAVPAVPRPARRPPSGNPSGDDRAPGERADRQADTRSTGAARTRKPAFRVPGAPPEPLDELPLPERAHRLAERLDGAPRPTRALVRHWLYQHAWVVTGARFGWSGGAEALRVLVALDRRLEARWGVGARSEAVARRALREVEARAR